VSSALVCACRDRQILSLCGKIDALDEGLAIVFEQKTGGWLSLDSARKFSCTSGTYSAI